jgi:hypothetical protein
MFTSHARSRHEIPSFVNNNFDQGFDFDFDSTPWLKLRPSSEPLQHRNKLLALLFPVSAEELSA